MLSQLWYADLALQSEEQDMSNVCSSLMRLLHAGVATPVPCQPFNLDCLGEGPSSRMLRTGM